MEKKFDLDKCVQVMFEIVHILGKYDIQPRELQHIATDLENLALKKMLTGKGFGED